MKTRNYRLLEAIDRKGMTQGALARVLGITETRFTRIMRGYVEPSEAEIEQICAKLNLTSTELGFESVGSQIQFGEF